MIKRLCIALVLTLRLVPAAGAEPSSTAQAARVVAWQPKEGMAREFELGYQRHLEWHRAQSDPWAWHGWSIVSGPRTGYFVDGTFFHRWTDFDSPVAPQQDAADNAVNVAPYAKLHGVAAYETIPELSRFDATHLSAPFLTFTYIEVAPGRAAEFEALVPAPDRGAASRPASFALLRPVAGTHEYLLIIPARSQSDLAAHAGFAEQWLAAVAKQQGSTPIVERMRTETGRYRADLSYVPR